MAQTPMSARPIRKLNPLEQGGALMDGQGPYALQQAQQDQATAAQQAQMEAEQAAQTDPEEQALEALKQQKDQLSKSNKVKELSLSIEEEIAKQEELEARLQQNPKAMERLLNILRDHGLA